MTGWLFVFHGISTFVGYLTPNSFYTNNQFCFKEVSLVKVLFLTLNCLKK